MKGSPKNPSSLQTESKQPEKDRQKTLHHFTILPLDGTSSIILQCCLYVALGGIQKVTPVDRHLNSITALTVRSRGYLPDNHSWKRQFASYKICHYKAMSDAVTPDQGSVQLYRVITTPFILSSDKERHSRERRFSREGEGIRVDEASSKTASSTTSKAVGTTVIGSGTSHGFREDEV